MKNGSMYERTHKRMNKTKNNSNGKDNALNRRMSDKDSKR